MHRRRQVLAATATFACGGLINLVDTLKDGGATQLTIRRDVGDYRDHHKITFPCSPKDFKALKSFLQHCQPATFGQGSRDVLDEDYRKAGNLDNTAFSTNFHPHDYGIVDAVQQILMPSAVGGGKKSDSNTWGVRVELYKLNVLEVTSGHRVTLTYNLYSTSLGNLARPMSDPMKLPFYSIASEILREPEFMSKGGCIGFFCHHAYAHSTEAGRKLLPGVLKGVDLAVYSASTSLGLAVDVRPVLTKRRKNVTIAGTEMHGPTLNGNEDDELDEVVGCSDFDFLHQRK
ncbi:MAG: hypothetical protein Q9218_005158 [Villophora microphyllina]